MSEDLVTIEVDGRELKARPGAMLIEVTDNAGIYIPRFCYHKHLTVAANCRMCLVEVERAPKPLPACATPVMDGMKVFTRSEYAVDAQHSTMEFLLINHPLDCPICDQGGECELQDLAMGYGGDVSRYTERKRVVRDKNIGPLVQTDMTRCIHCTRCVRFGEEIAGLRELGATGRSEHMEIGTYIEKAMTSELSGNVIDMCPVGALTSKPYRYSARAWELQQRDGVAAHDCLGSNIHFHIKEQVVKRVIPREHSTINETWLSDRDRYSYEGMNHAERLTVPRIKRDGRWSDCNWDTALDTVARQLGQIAGDDPRQLAALVSPSSTTEEFYLMQRLVRELGCHNIDHRLRQRDFSAENTEPHFPYLTSLTALENADAILLAGSFPRHEQPLLNLRVRKAALKGAAVIHVDSYGRSFNYDLFAQKLVKPSQLTATMAGMAVATAEHKHIAMEGPSAETIEGLAIRDESIGTIAEQLAGAERVFILAGATVQEHSNRSALCQIIAQLAQSTGATVGYLAAGANAAGAWLAGAVPHRGPAGRLLEQGGINARAMFEDPRRAYVLLGIEPDLDCGDTGRARSALEAAEFVVAVSAYENDAINASADVILPMAIYAENEGSVVNLMGNWQRFAPAVSAQGDARAAWKILRVIGDKLELPGFDAVSCEDVTHEIELLAGDIIPSARRLSTFETSTADVDNEQLELIADVPMYASDAIVRHARALQEMPQSGDDRVRVSTATAAVLRMRDGAHVKVSVGDAHVITEIAIDDGVPDGVCVIHAARAANAEISINGARVELVATEGIAAA